MKSIAAAVLVAAVGCTSTVNERRHNATAIRVTANPEVVRGCTYLGQARGRREGKIRKEAAILGANTLFLANPEGPSGEAYRCEQPH